MKASINGTEIFFDVEGLQFVPDGPIMRERPVCFLIHGGPGLDHATYMPDVSPLADFMQLVYIDNRGSGRSGRPGKETYNLYQDIEDVEALRKYLGLEKIVILGHSYGGMVAAGYAAKYGENLESVLLLGTSPVGSFWEDARQELKNRGTEEQIAFGEYLFNGEFESDAQYVELFEKFYNLYGITRTAYTEANRNGNDRMIVSSEVVNTSVNNGLREFDFIEDLKKTNVPALVIGGRHDWITPVKYSCMLAEAMPNSELIIFENSGHSFFADVPQETLAAIREFVEKHWHK
ncbi:MAG: alpha/beta hydrolase [Clostridia bacterium]|nr:alpha/beta hydrolase [Clostridia bacterium]